MTNRDQDEKHDHHESSKTCKVCASSYNHESHPSFFGICERCGYKILIALICFMIVISYMVWFGVFW
jgi:hypothetical protein